MPCPTPPFSGLKAELQYSFGFFFFKKVVNMVTMTNREIEVRFLEIDKEKLVKQLRDFGAKDLGEDLLTEIIFYDKDLRWRDKEHKHIRLRKRGEVVTLTYKQWYEKKVDGVEEVEFDVSDIDQAHTLLEKLGLVAFRYQEKRRHTFILDGVTIDIDTWPKIPTYVEFEGESEADLKRVSKKLGFNWSDAVFDSPRRVIENVYKIPIGGMKWFTFSRFE